MTGGRRLSPWSKRHERPPLGWSAAPFSFSSLVYFLISLTYFFTFSSSVLSASPSALSTAALPSAVLSLVGSRGPLPWHGKLPGRPDSEPSTSALHRTGSHGSSTLALNHTRVRPAARATFASWLTASTDSSAWKVRRATQVAARCSKSRFSSRNTEAAGGASSSGETPALALSTLTRSNRSASALIRLASCRVGSPSVSLSSARAMSWGWPNSPFFLAARTMSCSRPRLSSRFARSSRESSAARASRSEAHSSPRVEHNSRSNSPVSRGVRRRPEAGR
mmetsp:Transcript_20723/g.46717  ORF Transcript_20723/g.46717 Transcript_20723/m.46717 type:complete len:279 (-) Transcript_20723:202-1038(-)